MIQSHKQSKLAETQTQITTDASFHTSIAQLNNLPLITSIQLDNLGRDHTKQPSFKVKLKTLIDARLMKNVHRLLRQM